MLVRLTELKGPSVWVNPIHVKAVRGRAKYTEVIIPINTALGQAAIKVKESPEEVVELLNTGMPDFLPPLPLDDDSGGGAAAAAMMG